LIRIVDKVVVIENVFLCLIQKYAVRAVLYRIPHQRIVVGIAKQANALKIACNIVVGDSVVFGPTKQESKMAVRQCVGSYRIVL